MCHCAPTFLSLSLSLFPFLFFFSLYIIKFHYNIIHTKIHASIDRSMIHAIFYASNLFTRRVVKVNESKRAQGKVAARKEREKERRHFFRSPHFHFSLKRKEKKINCLIRIISEWHGGEDLPVFYHSNNYFRSIIGKEARNNRLSTPIKEYTCGIGSLRREREQPGRLILSLKSIDRLSTRTVAGTRTRAHVQARTQTTRPRTHTTPGEDGVCEKASDHRRGSEEAKIVRIIAAIAEAAGVALETTRPPSLRKKRLQTHSRVIVKRATVVERVCVCVYCMHRCVHRQRETGWRIHVYQPAFPNVSSRNPIHISLALNDKRNILESISRSIFQQIPQHHEFNIRVKNINKWLSSTFWPEKIFLFTDIYVHSRR